MAPVRRVRERTTLSEIQQPEGNRQPHERQLEDKSEQIRRDEELARRLQNGDVDAIAEQTLSAEEIAAILGEDFHDPRTAPARQDFGSPTDRVMRIDRDRRRRNRLAGRGNPGAPPPHHNGIRRVGGGREMAFRRRRAPSAADYGYGARMRVRSRVHVIHVHQTDDNDTRTEVQLDSDSDDDSDADNVIDVSDEESEGDGTNEGALDDSRHFGNNTYGRDSFVVDDNDHSSSDSDSDEEEDDLDESVREVYQGELELIPDEGPSTSGNGGRPRPAASMEPKHSPFAIRTGRHGHCTICFEDKPYDPMSCMNCKQLVGCKGCVQVWWDVGVQAKKNGPQSMYEGHPPNNHFQCPLCRHTWKRKPQVVSSLKF